MFILLFLYGCSEDDKSTNLFKYKNSYIGDNSAVVSIINRLPNQKYFEGVKLKTDKRPFGMIIKYSEAESTKETEVYNASFLFALLKNAEWLTFEIGEQTQTITKKELENWYGEKLSRFKNEEELKTFVGNFTQDETKMKQLINK
jgi:hypothetical protein